MEHGVLLRNKLKAQGLHEWFASLFSIFCKISRDQEKPSRRKKGKKNREGWAEPGGST